MYSPISPCIIYYSNSLCDNIIDALPLEYYGDNLRILEPASGTGNFISPLLKKYPNRKFSFALQEKALGTADAIYAAKDFILEGDEIFIAYSDMVFSKDLEIIYQKNNFDGIIFYFEVEDPQIKYERILEEAEKLKIDKSDVVKTLEKLKQEGLIFEPRKNIFKKLI